MVEVQCGADDVGRSGVEQGGVFDGVGVQLGEMQRGADDALRSGTEQGGSLQCGLSSIALPSKVRRARRLSLPRLRLMNPMMK